MNPQSKKIPLPAMVLVLVFMLVFIVGVPLLPLLISWHWDWWEAWSYAIPCVAGFAVGRFLALRRHPELLAERAHFLDQEDAKPWDKLVRFVSHHMGVVRERVERMEGDCECRGARHKWKRNEESGCRNELGETEGGMKRHTFAGLASIGNYRVG